MTTSARRSVLSLAVVLAGITLAAASWRGPSIASQTSASRPQRIISVVPAVTEMLFAIGAGDAVVGVSSYDRFPPAVESRPKVGALVDPDFERILSLKPDLVVVYESQNDLIERLGRVNIPIFNYRHAGLADITTTIAALGARIGRAAEAGREVDRLNRELDDVRRLVAGKPRPRTVLLFGRELGSLRSMFASGGVGFLHDMLGVAGAVNVFEDARQQGLQVSTETLIARAPEVILELQPTAGWTPERIVAERAVWRGLPTLPAVRANRIAIIADDLMLVPGPRVGTAARMMAKAIHP